MAMMVETPNVRRMLDEMDDYFYGRWLIKTGLYLIDGTWKRYGNSIYVSALDLTSDNDDDERITVIGTDANDNYKEMKVNGNILLGLMRAGEREHGNIVNVKSNSADKTDIKYFVI